MVQGSISEVAKELIPSITQLLVDEEKPAWALQINPLFGICLLMEPARGYMLLPSYDCGSWSSEKRLLVGTEIIYNLVPNGHRLFSILR